jgi:hypothetical protein
MSRSICFSNRVYRRRRSNRLFGWSLTKPISPQRPTSSLSPSGTPCTTCGSFSRRDFTSWFLSKSATKQHGTPFRHAGNVSSPPPSEKETTTRQMARPGIGRRRSLLHILQAAISTSDSRALSGSGDGAPSYTSCRSRLRPATFLAVSRVIEKKCATPSGSLTKDDGENGRRDRQAALDAADLRSRGAATAISPGRRRNRWSRLACPFFRQNSDHGYHG